VLSENSLQEGELRKISKGVYRFDPDFQIHSGLEDFTPGQKEIIVALLPIEDLRSYKNLPV
jgi:hypothetical protein